MVSSGADIQIEKGSYTRIHNAILEQLAYHDFASREYACILYLLRMTYGFNRKDAKLSNSDFAKATHLDRTAIIKTLRRLVERNVIIKGEGDPYHAATWSFNKYVEQWDTQASVKTTTSQNDTRSSVKTTTSQNETSSRFDTSTSPQNDTTSSVETTTSYISAKDIKDNYKDSSSKEEAAAVFACWKDNMPGTLSAILADDLGDLIDTYGGDTVIRAITEAVRSNGRSIKYVSKILENWAVGGKHRNGTAPPPTNGIVAGFSLDDVMGTNGAPA